MLRILLAMLASIAMAASAQAQGEPRFALVIGNEAYSGALSKLNRPHEDADRIDSALRATGFAVTPRKDEGRSDILKEVRALADRLKQAGPNAIGFFYYSGHGASAQVGSRRQNFLIPTGADISTADELVSEGVPLDTIVGLLESTGAKAIFIVFDACRSELPWSKGGADPDKAFNTVAVRPGLFIAFSTDAGATSPDDGLFSAALAEQLVKPGVPHVLAFDDAAQQVGRQRATDRLPWYSNQVQAKIYFGGRLVTSDAVSTKPLGPPVDCTKQPQPFVVYYEWNKADLTSANIETFRLAFERARQGGCRVAKVEIRSHTDSSREEGASGVGEQRARRISEAVQILGIPGDLVDSKSLGKTYPAYPTADGVREPLNRRAEVTITLAAR